MESPLKSKMQSLELQKALLNFANAVITANSGTKPELTILEITDEYTESITKIFK